MFSEKRKFKNSKGLNLYAVYEGEEKNSPVVVLCHGYGSSKDNEAPLDLAKKLTTAGLSVYRFDFLGCGESEGTMSELTPQEGLEDLNLAIKDLGIEKLALCGSSFGGFISLIYASKRGVRALGLKAPVSDYPAVMLAKGNEKENRAPNFEEQAKKFDIYKLAEQIKAPTLIVHGSIDKDVPLEQSEKLLEHLGGEKRLAIIHNAPHGMRGPGMQDAHNRLLEFFIEKLL